MKYWVLIFLLGGALSDDRYWPAVIPREAVLTSRTALVEDSEVGYTLKYHAGDIRAWSKGRPPDKTDYSAVCWKGSVRGLVLNLWNYGKSEEIRKRRLALKSYMKLWRVLEEIGVWDLESPMDVLKRLKSQEEGPYTEFLSDQEWWQFRFRIGLKEHRLEVYYVQGLKDKRYLRILREINKFLKVKNVKISKMALSTAQIK